MWKRYGLNIAAIILVLLVRMLVVPVVLPKEYGAFHRIMSNEIRKDYPMYDLVNIKNLQSASARSGYSMEILIAIDLLMANQMDPNEAQAGIEDAFNDISVPESFKLEQMPDKIMEIYDTYNLPSKWISTLFEIIMVILSSTILYYVLYFAGNIRKRPQDDELKKE